MISSGVQEREVAAPESAWHSQNGFAQAFQCERSGGPSAGGWLQHEKMRSPSIDMRQNSAALSSLSDCSRREPEL